MQLRRSIQRTGPTSDPNSPLGRTISLRSLPMTSESRAIYSRASVVSKERTLLLFLGIAICLALPVSTSAQSVSVLYSFKKNSLSQRPGIVTPAQGRDGSLYGTTTGSQSGTVFRVSTKGSGGQLFALSGTNGSGPSAGVTLATDGNLYG